MLRGFIFSAMIGWAGAAAAADAPRAPTAPWVVDFHESQCVAYRPYGTDEYPLHLVLKSPALGEVMQLSVMRKGNRSIAAQVDAKITLDDSSPIATSMLMIGARKDKLTIYQINMPSSEFARVSEAKSLAIDAPGLDVSFALSDMKPLLKIMDECVVDLRRAWYVKDVNGTTSALATRATANLAELITDRDYPTVALTQGQSGTVGFVLLINEKGRVADCTVTQTSGIASLDAQSCALLTERAQFTPAMDVDGKPARDAVSARILWQVGGPR